MVATGKVKAWHETPCCSPRPPSPSPSQLPNVRLAMLKLRTNTQAVPQLVSPSLCTHQWGGRHGGWCPAGQPCPSLPRPGGSSPVRTHPFGAPTDPRHPRATEMFVTDTQGLRLAVWIHCWWLWLSGHIVGLRHKWEPACLEGRGRLCRSLP